MSYTRRAFLKNSGLLSAATLIGLNNIHASNTKKLQDFGIQLYTLRDVIMNNPLDIIKKVAEYGYTQIEGFEGPKGIFWGLTTGDFKKFLDDNGLSYLSTHCNINKDFEQKAADAASVGMKYLIAPSIGPQKSVDEWKRVAETFNEKGEICRKNGLRFAYHNHDYTFKPIEGQMPQDLLLNNTNPETVDFEMDIYWVITAGADPVAYLKKYEDRFKLGHVKDREKNATPGDHNASTILGQGSIDYPTILKWARKCGMEYFIVEQEKYAGSTPLDSAEKDAAYMKQISI